MNALYSRKCMRETVEEHAVCLVICQTSVSFYDSPLWTQDSAICSNCTSTVTSRVVPQLFHLSRSCRTPPVFQYLLREHGHTLPKHKHKTRQQQPPILEIHWYCFVVAKAAILKHSPKQAKTKRIWDHAKIWDFIERLTVIHVGWIFYGRKRQSHPLKQMKRASAPPWLIWTQQMDRDPPFVVKGVK